MIKKKLWFFKCFSKRPLIVQIYMYIIEIIKRKEKTVGCLRMHEIILFLFGRQQKTDTGQTVKERERKTRERGRRWANYTGATHTRDRRNDRWPGRFTL